MSNSDYIPTVCVSGIGVRAFTVMQTLAAMQVTSLPPRTQSLLNTFIFDGSKWTSRCTRTMLRDLLVKPEASSKEKQKKKPFVALTSSSGKQWRSRLWANDHKAVSSTPGSVNLLLLAQLKQHP